MVRRARFSFDDGERIDVPEREEIFDDFDDPVLDDDVPVQQDRPEKRKRRADGRSALDSPSRETERRHLAGADWINERSESPPRQPRE